MSTAPHPRADGAFPALGRRIRRLRQLRGWKQGVLAEAAGVAQTTVSRWESGALEPDAETAARLLSLLQRGSGNADAALRRLVESSGLAMHLVTDADHRLLAASPSREREWRRTAGDLLGHSLWRYATDPIAAAETRLDVGGWWDEAAPEAVSLDTGGGDRGLRILPGTMLWERLYLADGTPARLCTSLTLGDA